MKIKKIEKKEFEKLIKQFSNRFAILEPQIIESEAYIVEYNTLSDIINKIDFSSFQNKIREETKLENFAENGSLLVSVSEKSPLIEEFINKWADWNGGIFIDAGEFDEDEILAHLRSILITYLENVQVQFRLQEPRKLFGVLSSLDEYKRRELLGPIKTIVWQENHGKGKTYYTIENSEPQYTENKFGWFVFSASELSIIDNYEKVWAKKCIFSDVLYDINNIKDKPYHLKIQSEDEIITCLENSYLITEKYKIYNTENIHYFLFNDFYYPNLFQKADVFEVIANQVLTEEEKITKLKNIINKINNRGYYV